ncbi:MAG TPA: M20/M25/M40 family metallo-hydrolase, partial [Gemmatimonadales bacterium]|nr:M20/M25/M40 family metallo-hydrolase [Gemmatimonadales bacterium]
MTRLLLVLIFIAAPLAAQTPPPASRPGATAVAASDTTATARIIREIAEHQQAVAWTEYLSDIIGPRLTTSPQIAHAHAWAESTMTRFGATNVHQEGYEFGPSWTRGEATARLLTQNGKSLELAAAGWSAPTGGPVRGDLVVVQSSTVDGLRKFIGQFKGKFVTYGELPPRGSDTAEARMVGAQLVSAMEKEGALGFILNAGNHDGLGMTGGPVWRLGAFVPRIPVAFMARKDYLELRRLAEHGERVTLEVNLPSTTSKKPVRQYNTIGEIRGSEKPGEVVIIGGHIDSWDLGTGATDNGTGVASVMEALRAIKASGLTPKRTIRVVLFSGEEQG